MTMPAFTVRNVAKFAAKAIVAGKTAEITADAMADYTQFEEDDLTVVISSRVIGWYIGEKLEPITDKIVDKTADFVTEKRAKRKAKKDAK